MLWLLPTGAVALCATKGILLMLRSLSMAAAMLAAIAAPASAQMVSAADPASLVTVLQAKGYQAELTKSDDGDPMIRSAMDGSKFIILFYGCTKNRACQTIQFYAGFKSDGEVSIETMNEWNKENRFGRAYIDADKDPVVEMDVDLDDGGMSRALFEDVFEFWEVLMPDFKKTIGR